MPSLTINGHSVNVDDSFDKLSPEEQNATVDHIAKTLHDGEKPSGVGAGFAHGVSTLASDVASTLGLAGVKSEKLDDIAAKTAPKDYKSAPIIREGGHWYNPSDYTPGNIPQALAEQFPGMAQDFGAGFTGAKVGKAVGGVRGAAIGGIGAGLGSMALRTFGPGAHENADARTGVPGSEVTSPDMLREGGKQLVAAPLNAVGLGKLIPGIGGKVAGVGLSGTGNALKNYLATVGTEAVAGGARDAINQVGTTVGTDKGTQYDPNRTAEAAITGGAGSGLLVAPRLAGKLHNSAKYREFGGDNAAASEALANRQIEAADGKALVGKLGGTKTAAEAVAAAHKDVQTELTTASRGLELSQDNNNTLTRIKDGGKASQSELRALDGEAPAEVVHLARQAMLSSKLKSMGDFGEDRFTGGLSGLMEKRLRPLYNPTATAASAAAAALGGGGALGMIGMSAPHVLGAVYGSYLGARTLDKLTGARSPAKGFTDTFANPDAPIRTPVPDAPLPEQRTTSVPQIAPPQNTQLWGTPLDPEPNLRPTLNANAKVDEGMAKMAKRLGDEKRKAMISETMPALAELAKTRPVTTDEPAQAPVNISPIALKMLQSRLKEGLPPEPTAPETPAPAPAPDAFEALRPLMGRQRAIMRGLAASNKQQMAQNVAQRKAAGIAQAEGIAADSPIINEHGGLETLSNPEFTKRGSQLLSAANVMRKLTAQPAEEAQAPVSQVPGAGPPASEAIGALMEHLRAKSAMNGQAAPAAPTPEPAPVSPLMEKITKKSGKAKVEQTPEENSYVPMDAEQLWGRGMHDDVFAKADAAKLPDLKYPERYQQGIERDRKLRRNTIGDVLGDETGPDAAHAVALLEELHHTRRADKAQGAIKHFTAKMSPGLRAAMRARLGKDFVSSMWKK